MKAEPLTEFQFEGKKISKKKVLSVWKSITDKPFPFGGIKAYLLKNEEFERVVTMLDNRSDIFKNQCLWEYGKKLSVEDSDAVVFVAGTSPRHNYFCILIKKHGNFTLEENLKHELGHIAKGEVRMHNKEE